MRMGCKSGRTRPLTLMQQAKQTLVLSVGRRGFPGMQRRGREGIFILQQATAMYACCLGRGHGQGQACPWSERGASISTGVFPSIWWSSGDAQGGVHVMPNDRTRGWKRNAQ